MLHALGVQVAQQPAPSAQLPLQLAVLAPEAGVAGSGHTLAVTVRSALTLPV